MTIYAASNAGIFYSPGNWDVASDRAATITPGAYLRFTVAGATGISLTFDMTNVSSPAPYLKYKVDQGGWVSVQLAAMVPLVLPAGNTWDKHTVTVVVQSTSEYVGRWNVQNAIVKLTGIDAAGATDLQAGGRKPLTGLVLGDSITEGFQTLQAVTDPVGSDATCAWAYLLGENLGAEIGVIGYGGTGFGHAGAGGVPSWEGTTHTNLWGGGPTRDYAAINPDFICIALGQNDAATDDAAWSAALRTLLDSLLAKTANTRIFVVRAFFGGKAAQAQSTVAALGNSRVSYVDTTGWYDTGAIHPLGYVSQTVLAPKAAEAIRAGLSGVPVRNRFIFNSKGDPVPV